MRSPQGRLAVSALFLGTYPADSHRYSVLPATITIGAGATPRCPLASSGACRYFRWMAQRRRPSAASQTCRSRPALRDIKPKGMANRPDVQQIAGRIPEVSKLDRPDRRIELIRARLEAYYDVESRGPGRVSWRTICDEMCETIGVKMDAENLRQFVRRTMRRGRPRIPEPENIEAILSFLCHPDIDMLSREEFEEPEIPLRFLQSFQELLRIKSKGDMLQNPYWLNGLFEAWHQVDGTDQTEEIWIKTTLRLSVDQDRYFVHAAETWETHIREPGETLVFSGNRPSEGWGTATPEKTLFLFMKTKPYDSNYYYLTLAEMYPNMMLLRHEHPADCDSTAKTFEELIKHTKQRTLLLHFNRLYED
jgi:hypothetical protein